MEKYQHTDIESKTEMEGPRYAEIGSILLTTEESNKINEIVNLSYENVEEPESFKHLHLGTVPNVKNTLPMFTGGTLFPGNGMQVFKDILNLKREDNTLLFVFSIATPLELPFAKWTLADGRKLVMYCYMFTTANVIKTRVYPHKRLGLSGPFNHLYVNTHHMGHAWNLDAPDEIIYGHHFYNRSNNLGIPHMKLSDFIFSDDIGLGDINIAVVKNQERVVKELGPLPLEIVKTKCISLHWDKVINPWQYLQNDVVRYTAHPDVQQFISRWYFFQSGDSKLQEGNCRSIPGNPPIRGNVQHLMDEVKQKEIEYDNLFLNKANLTTVSGQALWNGNVYDRFWRGMSKPYNVDSNGDYQILNYLHTSVSQQVAQDFIQGIDNPTLYCFLVQPGIPYISYDNNPYCSHFNLGEREVLFMRDVIARPIGLRQINPHIHSFIPSQVVRLIPSATLLTRIQRQHLQNTLTLTATLSGQVPLGRIADKIVSAIQDVYKSPLIDGGPAPIPTVSVGGTKRLKRKKRKRTKRKHLPCK
jgi:hypothetical protein